LVFSSFAGWLRAGLRTGLFGRGFNPNCLAIEFPFARPAGTLTIVLPTEIPRRIDHSGKQEKYVVGASSPGILGES